MTKLIYEMPHTVSKLMAHPVLRRPPLYIGPLAQYPEIFADRHLLKLAIVTLDNQEIITISWDEVVDAVNERLSFDSVIKGFDFHRNWALLHGPLSEFDGSGIMVLDRRASDRKKRVYVVGDGLSASVRSRRVGDSSYTPEARKALGVAGAQLYLCERLMAGGISQGSAASRRDIIAEKLSPMLLPLRVRLRQGNSGLSALAREETRYSDGAIGDDDPIYKGLLRDGSSLVTELHSGHLPKAAIGRMWSAIGAKLRLHTECGPAHTDIAERAMEMLRAALDMACAAFEREKAIRAERGRQSGSLSVAVNVPGGELLVEGGGPGELMPNVFALTRLAWLWNVNPADFFGGLSAWRLHFEAARFLGQRHFGRAVGIGGEAHWGVRALRPEIFDNLIDPETRASRIWLRQFIGDESEWDSEPNLLKTNPVRPPAWRFRATRKRRQPPLSGDRLGTVDPKKV